MSKELRTQCMYLEDASIKQLEVQLAKRKADLESALKARPKRLSKINWNPLIELMEQYHIQMVHNFVDTDVNEISQEDILNKVFECAYGSEILKWQHEHTLRYPDE